MIESNGKDKFAPCQPSSHTRRNFPKFNDAFANMCKELSFATSSNYFCNKFAPLIILTTMHYNYIYN